MYPNTNNNRKFNKPFNKFKKDEPYRVNEFITGLTHVRIVGENVESKIVTIQEARALAREQETDLVEISPKAEPPVCKICDYQKFKYDQKRNKPKPVTVEVKEIRFGPNTDEHDFNFKLKHGVEFLKKGDKVKATVFFSGREIAHKERGEIILLKFATGLEEFGKVEAMPKLEGKRMSMMIMPKAGKKKQ